MVPKVIKSYVGNWEWQSSDKNIRFSFQPRVSAEFWWKLRCSMVGQAQYGDITFTIPDVVYCANNFSYGGQSGGGGAAGAVASLLSIASVAWNVVVKSLGFSSLILGKSQRALNKKTATRPANDEGWEKFDFIEAQMAKYKNSTGLQDAGPSSVALFPRFSGAATASNHANYAEISFLDDGSTVDGKIWNAEKTEIEAFVHGNVFHGVYYADAR